MLKSWEKREPPLSWGLQYDVCGALPLHVTGGMRVLGMTLHEGVLARQLLELGGGHEACVVEQQGFVGRRRDAHQRSYLRVRDFAAPERIVIAGNSASLLATRTRSRAVTSSQPTRHDIQCAHDSAPWTCQPPR